MFEIHDNLLNVVLEKEPRTCADDLRTAESVARQLHGAVIVYVPVLPLEKLN